MTKDINTSIADSAVKQKEKKLMVASPAIKKDLRRDIQTSP